MRCRSNAPLLQVFVDCIYRRFSIALLLGALGIVLPLLMKSRAAPTTTAAETESARPRSANYALAMLTAIYVFNYADRAVLNLLLDSIKRDLRLTDTELGLITGFAFVLFYSLLGLPIARWADRFNRRLILTAGLIVWSAMTCFSGLAQSGWQLALARFGVGAGEACGVPPSHSMVSDLFPKEALPRALSILSAGSQIGSFVGLVLAGFVNQRYGWRIAFIVAGIPGIALAIFFRLTVREPQRGGAERGGVDTNLLSVARTILFLWRQRSFVITVIGGTLMGVSFYGFQVWTPAFLHRVRHLTSGTIGLYQGTVMGIFGLAGVLLGGFLAERLGKRDVRWRIYVPALGSVFSCPMNLLFLFLPSLPLSLLFWALAIICTSVYIGPIYAVYQSVAKVRMRAFASATFLFFGNLIGLGLGSLVIGMLSDALTKRYGAGAIRYSMVFPSVIALLSGLLFWIGSRYFARDIATASASG
jgi:MFS family permease